MLYRTKAGMFVEITRDMFHTDIEYYTKIMDTKIMDTKGKTTKVYNIVNVLETIIKNH